MPSVRPQGRILPAEVTILTLNPIVGAVTWHTNRPAKLLADRVKLPSLRPIARYSTG